MTGRFVRIALSCLLLLAVASPSFAARRSSLAGNLLIQDMDDVFIFPHALEKYSRSVTFDFGTSSGLGSGGMVFGNENVTLGAFAHRGDFMGALPSAFTSLGDIDNISADGTVSAPVGPDVLNWVDVLLGWQLGENPWGARVSVGRNSDDPPPDNVKQNSTGFNVVLGTNLAQWNVDASVEFAFLTAEETDATGTAESSPFQIAAAARRTAGEESDALALGWLGEFAFRSGSVDATPTVGTASSTDFSTLQFVGGLGPVYKPNARTNVAMYGTVELVREKTETTATTSTETNLTVPGWHLAAEVEVASWMQARAGFVSRYILRNDKTEPTTGTATEDKETLLQYDWTAGVGIHFDSFRIDGYFDPTVLTNGTSVFGTAGNRLFGMLSATYGF